MKIPFVTRARMDRELAAVREAARQEAEQAAPRFARQLAEAAAARAKSEASEIERRRQLAEAVAANTRLAGRNSELSRRLDSAHDMELGELGDVVLLEARSRHLEEELSAARADMDAKVAAAEERGRQAGRAMSPEEWLGRPVDGAPAERREPSAELLRERELARGLSAHLAEVQAANMRCTCSRQGAVS